MTVVGIVIAVGPTQHVESLVVTLTDGLFGGHGDIAKVWLANLAGTLQVVKAVVDQADLVFLETQDVGAWVLVQME